MHGVQVVWPNSSTIGSNDMCSDSVGGSMSDVDRCIGNAEQRNKTGEFFILR